MGRVCGQGALIKDEDGGKSGWRMERVRMRMRDDDGECEA